ncbi:MAG: hypothetical protein R3C05_06125 [Pirellulaceae bacterium]
MNHHNRFARRWKRSTFLGATFWLAVIVGLTVFQKWQPATAARLGEVFNFGGVAQQTTIQVPDVPLQSGDPIFLQSVSGDWTQVGHVLASNQSVDDGVVPVQWYGDDSSSGYTYTYHRNRGTLPEIVETLLPTEKREAIKRRIASTQRLYGKELTEAFKPVIEDLLRQSAPVIEAAIVRSVSDHQSELKTIGRRFERQIVDEKLVPLVRDEVLPIVRAHGEPVVTQIGREIYGRASLFRFGWRIVYDKSPLPQRDLMQREWERFMEEEAIPIVEARMDQIVLAIKDILRDVINSESIRHELADVLEDVATDAELQSVLTRILKEAIVENQELREVWTEIWKSQPAQDALELATQRLEPLVRQIGDEIFGTQEEGISPGFARVLRNQILHKDHRWIEAERVASSPQDQTTPVLRIAEEPKPYPLLFFAAQ